MKFGDISIGQNPEVFKRVTIVDPINTCVVTGFIGILGGAVAGYFVRTFVSRDASARKEDWDQLKDLSEQIDSLASSATEFYCNPRQEARERKSDAIGLQRSIKKICQATLAFGRSINDLSCTSSQVKLRQAITLEKFDTVSRAAMQLDDPFIQQIDDVCAKLLWSLQRSYFKRHRRLNF
jgi:hypothetical protein